MISFEAGHANQPHSEEMMSRIFSMVPGVSYRFVTKAEGGPIQAAEMFAGLHNRYIASLIVGQARMRAVLRALARNVPLFPASLGSVGDIFSLLARLGFPSPPVTLTGCLGQHALGISCTERELSTNAVE